MIFVFLPKGGEKARLLLTLPEKSDILYLTILDNLDGSVLGRFQKNEAETFAVSSVASVAPIRAERTKL